jgi:hypothetical protein
MGASYGQTAEGFSLSLRRISYEYAGEVTGIPEGLPFHAKSCCDATEFVAGSIQQRRKFPGAAPSCSVSVSLY